MNPNFRSLSTLQSLNIEKIDLLRKLGITNLGDLLAFQPFRYAQFVRAAKDQLLRKDEIIPYLDEAIRDNDIDKIIVASPIVLKGLGRETAKVLEQLGVKTVADLANYLPFAEAEEIVTKTVNDENDPYAPACVLPTCKKFTRNSKNFVSFFKQEEIRNLSILSSDNSLVSKLFNFTGSQWPKVIYLGYSVSFLQEWIYCGINLGEPQGSVSLFMGQDTQVSILDWKRINNTFRTEDTQISEYLSNLLFHQRAVDEVARATAEEHQYGGTSTFGANAATAGSFVAAGAIVGGVGGGISGAVAGLVLGNVANAAGGLPTLAGAAIGTAVGSVAGAAAGSLIVSGATTLGFVETDAEGDREIFAKSAQNIQQRTLQNSSSIRSFWSNIVSQSVQNEQQSIQTNRVTNHNRIHALNALYFEVLNEYRLNISANDFAPILFIPFKPIHFTKEILRRYWWVIRTFLADQKLVLALDEYFLTLSSDPSPAAELAELPRIEDIKTSKIEVNLNLDSSVMEELIKAVVGAALLGAALNVFRSLFDAAKRDKIKVSIITSSGTYNLSRDQSPNSDPNFVGRYTTTSTIPLHTIESIKIKNTNDEFSILDFDLNELAFEGVNATIKIKNKNSFQVALPQIGTLEDEQVIISETLIVNANRSKTVSWNIADQLRNQFEAVNEQVEELTAELESDELTKSKLNNLLGFLNGNKFGFTRLILQSIEKEQIVTVLEDVKIGGVELSSIASTTPLGFCGNHVVLSLKSRLPGDAQYDAIRVDTSQLELLLNQFEDINTNDTKKIVLYTKNLKSILVDIYQAIMNNDNKSVREQQFLELLEHLQVLLNQFHTAIKNKNIISAPLILGLFIPRIGAAINSILAFINSQTQTNNTAVRRLFNYYGSVKTSLAGKMGKIISSDEVNLPSPAVFMEPVLSHAKGAELYDMRRNSHYEILPAPSIGSADPNVLRSEEIVLNPNIPTSNLTIQNAPEFALPSSLSAVLAEAGKLNLNTLINTNAGTLNTTLSNLSTMATELAKASAQLTGDAQKQALASASEVAKQISDIVSKSLQTSSATPVASPSPQPPPPSTQQEKAEVERELKRIDESSSSDEQKKEQKKSIGAPLTPSTPRRNRTLNVRLQFESAYGIPITYDALAGLPKLFRLFHEKDIRNIDLGNAQELSNPLYIFALENWSESNGALAIEIDYGEGSFKKNIPIDIPFDVSTMIITAMIASRDQTITRARTTSHTTSLTNLIQTKFGVSATAAKKIVALADFGFGLNFEVVESITDADSTTGTDGTTVSETIKIPTGGLDIRVQFAN